MSKAGEAVYSSETMLRLQREVKENTPGYIHHRVYLAFKQLLQEGDFEAGDKLPTHAQLASFLHIGSPTVRDVMRRLADEGLVAGIPSQGTFVLQGRRDARRRSGVDERPKPAPGG